ncbi:sensor histidine kinase [Chitinasiproducens palmae]|uniref:histidine kinase n=1 Tax=Chitinasiproducens palmae TaxID=1770053 RepID=A0A1H2PTY4_9BURK|nr:PAS domain-containing sensor histidine kinase [Chitinasiproducens palmae]SDV50241.1 Signal transduction histidine kinase involved in nitrogen fixation and metabolism regulation [Chitinasiproducens palmae]
MLNSAQSWKSLLVRALIGATAFTAVLLLVLLALASANTEFFDRYYSWLYAANWAMALLLLFIVAALAGLILVRLRQRRFGTRLLTKLAVYFALVGMLPGGLIYLVSLQFVSRSIETWFDVNVETALDSGLTLGRGMLDNALTELRSRGRSMAEQLGQAGDENTTLNLLRLRDQYGIQDASIISYSRSRGIAEVARASSLLNGSLVNDRPSPEMLRDAREGGFSAIDGALSDEANPRDALRLRVILRIPSTSTALLDDERYLQLVQPVPVSLARNAEAVQRAYREYQEKALGRTGLRKMYIGTLTLALFLATFIGIIIALALGNQLARPLFLLARGTEEVARGDLTPKREIKTNDELGVLTQAFNAMTRQLSEARQAVETNRAALEQSKVYLESVLANLTAGVFVCDWQFRLTTANAGAQRILRQPFDARLNQPLDEIAGIEEFAASVRKAFAERDVAHGAGREEGQDDGHWQQQMAVAVPGEMEALTLLVRGTRLLNATETAATAGYVVVFDDISDLISAQRSVAWGEVARRLAHEIKNPLTPIQLSAERLQMKLEKKLDSADAEVLRRGATTIVNQVAAMKRMVDDFREYARTPPVVLHDLQLNELIAEVLALYGVEEGKGAIDVHLGDLPVIRGDATQLRQIIHNLLQNAQDAVADRQSPRVVLETKTVEYGDPDSHGHRRSAVRLSVSDNGPGFPARILTRAFEPYVTTKAKGTGLGLAMVKKIVDEHGARIDIRNRLLPDSDAIAGAQVSILFLQLADEAEPLVQATESARVG